MPRPKFAPQFVFVNVKNVEISWWSAGLLPLLLLLLPHSLSRPLSRCHSGVTFHQSHDVSHLSGGESSTVANVLAQKKRRVFATPLHPLAEEAAANGRRGLRFVAYLRALSRNSNITVHGLSGWAQLIHFYVKSQGKHIT